jgi:hypothetical protein
MSGFLRGKDRHARVSSGAIVAFAGILLVSVVLTALSLLPSGYLSTFLSDPHSWFDGMDRQIAFDAVANTANLLAAILAIAITVVAIVVELAANRYSHRISSLFIREPINIVVMTFFVIATIHSVWISIAVSRGEPSVLPTAGLLSSALMVTLALVILLPYFAFVLSFLSPVSVIDKIRRSVVTSIDGSDIADIAENRTAACRGIDELQDIARRASELSDRAVAMASINALADLVLGYGSKIGDLPDEWFEIQALSTGDPDFVSLSRTSRREIEEHGTWFEVKVMRQYLDLISDSTPSSRDISYLVAINTRRIGVAAIAERPQLVELCIHCFNSYLRATINNSDQRTSYYIMNQYRLLAEKLLEQGDEQAVREIALHFQYYGLLGYRMHIPFLLEVAAYDLMHLIEVCVNTESKLVDALVDLILTLDQEARRESQEQSLLGVRRVHIQLATFFVEQGDESRVELICEDLKTEQPERLRKLYRMLQEEDRPQYWEFTDRGVNFSYLAPRYRRHLDVVFSRLGTRGTDSPA